MAPKKKPAVKKKATRKKATRKKVAPKQSKTQLSPPNGKGKTINLAAPSGKASKRIRRHGTVGSAELAKRASSKSAYAADRFPERMEDAESQGLTVPHRDGGGFGSKQAGRAAPADRLHVPGRYKLVSASEASMNMSARQRGDLEPIEDGLDGPGREEEDEDTQEVQQMVEERHDVDSEDYDPLGGEAMPEPGDADLVAEEKALGQQTLVSAQVQQPAQVAVEVKQAERAVAPPVNAEQAGMSAYINKRCRISLELVDGAMSMAAIEVKVSKYGLTILLPLASEGATFIPKPGSEITVTQGEQSWDCYFPGIYFEVPELQLLGLAFVRKEEG